MKIYLAHATAFAFHTDLYDPLKNSPLWAKHEWILPHLQSTAIAFDSRPVIKTCDLVIVEISYASTGTGIEIGWALAHNIPVVAIHRNDANPSSAATFVARITMAYSGPEDIVRCLETILLKGCQ